MVNKHYETRGKRILLPDVILENSLNDEDNESIDNDEYSENLESCDSEFSRIIVDDDYDYEEIKSDDDWVEPNDDHEDSSFSSDYANTLSESSDEYQKYNVINEDSANVVSKKKKRERFDIESASSNKGSEVESVASYSDYSSEISSPELDKQYKFRSRKNFVLPREKQEEKKPYAKRRNSGKKRKISARHHKMTLDEIEEKMQVWEEMNKDYYNKLDNFLRHDLMACTSHRIFLRRIDAATLNHQNDIFRIMLSTMYGFDGKNFDLDFVFKALFSISQRGTQSPKLLLIINSWTKLLCCPNTFSMMEDLLKSEDSPYTFILHSQMCQEICLKAHGLKSLNTSINYETIFLLPAIGKLSHSDKIKSSLSKWYEFVFTKLILPEIDLCIHYFPKLESLLTKLKERKIIRNTQNNHNDSTHQIITNNQDHSKESEINWIFPIISVGYIFIDELKLLKRFPKQPVDLNSTVAPTNVLKEIRAVAYSYIDRNNRI